MKLAKLRRLKWLEGEKAIYHETPLKVFIELDFIATNYW